MNLEMYVQELELDGTEQLTFVGFAESTGTGGEFVGLFPPPGEGDLGGTTEWTALLSTLPL